MTILAAVSHFAALLDAPAVQTRLEGSLTEGAASWPGSSPQPWPQHQRDLAASPHSRAAICGWQMKDGLKWVKLTWLPRWERRQVKWGASREECSAFSRKNRIWVPQLLACPPGDYLCICSTDSIWVKISLALGYCSSLHSGWKKRDWQEALHRAGLGRNTASCFALILR